MTILIVNRDLGFAMWLGRALCEVGDVAMPATDVCQAKLLQQKLPGRVDVLMIEPCLAEAATFVEGLQRSNPRVKVFELAEYAVSTCAKASLPLLAMATGSGATVPSRAQPRKPKSVTARERRNRQMKRSAGSALRASERTRRPL